MTTRVILAASAAALAVAACGGAKKPAASEDKTHKALLQFAQCMREHGVDMPDPQFDDDGNGRVTISQRAGKGDPGKVDVAQKACQKYMKDAKPQTASSQDNEKFRKQALDNARCMREHGIDMPDPQFGDSGTVRMQLPKGVKPDSARFKAAMEACHGTSPIGTGQ